LAINPLGSRTRQEGNHGANVFGLAEPVAGTLAGDELDNLFWLSSTEKGGIDRSWRNGVDGNATGTEVFGKYSRNLLDGAFRCDVGEGVRENCGCFCETRGEENNTAAG
jgi:hypothetical protein